jgi:hypothetical protein
MPTRSTSTTSLGSTVDSVWPDGTDEHSRAVRAVQKIVQNDPRLVQASESRDLFALAFGEHLSVGRVQTPGLTMLMERLLAIRDLCLRIIRTERTDQFPSPRR